MEMQYLDFDDPQWAQYEGAYGNMSEAVRRLLEQPDDKELAECVYQGINHQMDFYSAAYLVLPYLVKLLEEQIAVEKVEWAEYCLFNIAMVIACDNFFLRRSAVRYDKSLAQVPQELKQNYRTAIRKCRKTARRFYWKYRKQLTNKAEAIFAKLPLFWNIRTLTFWLITHM